MTVVVEAHTTVAAAGDDDSVDRRTATNREVDVGDKPTRGQSRRRIRISLFRPDDPTKAIG